MNHFVYTAKNASNFGLGESEKNTKSKYVNKQRFQ